MRITRHAAVGAAVACALLAGCAPTKTIGETSADDPLTKTFPEGKRPQAPDFSGTSLDGKKISLSDYRGKFVVLNVWASWCGPCRGEAPELQKIHDKWSKRGVQVLGMDNDTSADNGRAFQREYHLSYPSLHDPSGKQLLKLPRGMVNAQSIPFTLIVDPQGKITTVKMGEVTERQIAPLLKPR
ncbi:TlpA family protein disulfide reductase [Streptomyces sp. NPDC058989]|uniref:TlpA family protein disulfide reductase n=1 Tax=Streptomyces sp. NPDC058989 TaxID=3346686 RepID=UPI0036B11CAC